MAGNQQGFLKQSVSALWIWKVWILLFDIDPLISEVTHENNINIAEINEEEREAFVNPASDFYENESDSDEDIYAPEDDHRKVFDIFEDIEH